MATVIKSLKSVIYRQGPVRKFVFAAILVSVGSASAFAADFPARPYTKAPFVTTPINWSGFYIGGNLGYGWGNNSTDVSFLPDPVSFGEPNTSLDNNLKGVLGGVQIGYNWQFNSIVTGLEADFQGSSIKSSVTRSPVSPLDPPGSFLTTSEKSSWFGTLRGRLGTTITPDLLVYATGGLAYGHNEFSADTHFLGAIHFQKDINKTNVGWTVGAGGEWAFARNWSVKLEYLFLDLGKESVVAGAAPLTTSEVGYSWKTQENIIRTGLNYHF